MARRYLSAILDFAKQQLQRMQRYRCRPSFRSPGPVRLRTHLQDEGTAAHNVGMHKPRSAQHPAIERRGLNVLVLVRHVSGDNREGFAVGRRKAYLPEQRATT